ncbi:hypothetical protein QTP88_014762 [Uroleucon formosanum]
MARQQQFLALWLVFAVLVYDNHGYVSHRRGKNQRPGVRGYPDDDKNGDGSGVGADINVCALEQKTTINLYCYCDDSKLHAASSADCWVFNDGEPRDSAVWREFRSQSNVTKLTFNVRGTSSKTLSFVPTEALARMPELRTLEIVYADIGTVHSHAFANLSRLQDLALVRNNIVQLARDSIAYMDDLRVVTLGDNAIESISNDVFARLPALRKLYMDRNNISYIAEGAFEQLRKLEELDLSDNRLTGSLSRYVFLGLVSVKRLDMRANHLDRVGPEAFAELVCLEELVLEDNVIKKIDGGGFSGLPSLQRLILAENRLTALDDRTFHSLDKLKFIDIRYNNLQTLTFGVVEPILERIRNSTFFFHFKDIYTLKKPFLIQYCENKNLKTTGNTNVLRARLSRYLRGAITLEDVDDSLDVKKRNTIHNNLITNKIDLKKILKDAEISDSSLDQKDSNKNTSATHSTSLVLYENLNDSINSFSNRVDKILDNSNIPISNFQDQSIQIYQNNLIHFKDTITSNEN